MKDRSSVFYTAIPNLSRIIKEVSKSQILWILKLTIMLKEHICCLGMMQMPALLKKTVASLFLPSNQY